VLITLQESLRSLANVITRGHPVAPRPTAPVLLPQNGSGVSNSTLPFPEDDPEPFAEEQPQETSSSNGTKRPRRSATPKVLTDVDFATGDLPFRVFVEQKNPRDQFERYLLVASWFKDQRDTDTITTDHIYTAYKFMGAPWNIPSDVGSPFRDMKAKKGWFDNGDKRNSWKITHIGEDRVTRMPSAQ
jgi:hypothetical protein